MVDWVISLWNLRTLVPYDPDTKLIKTMDDEHQVLIETSDHPLTRRDIVHPSIISIYISIAVISERCVLYICLQYSWFVMNLVHLMCDFYLLTKMY